MRASSLRTALLTLLPVALAAPASATPVVRPAQVTLSLRIAGLPPQPGFSDTFTVGGSASVTVDATSQSISLATGAVQLTGAPLTYPVDTTSIHSLTLTRLTNLAGQWSPGGAQGIAGEPPCPLTGTGACVPQTGFGGTMGLAGQIDVVVLSNLITLPIDLAALQIGRGGASLSTPAASGDPAPWTIGAGQVQLASHTPYGRTLFTTTGSVTASGFTLVSPNAVKVLLPTPVLGRLHVQFTDGLGLPAFVSQTVPVPEPGALVLLASGVALGSLAVRGRRRRSTRRSR